MRLAFATVLVAAAAVTGAAAAEDEETPTRDCRARIESGRGPLGFDRVQALVVGPLAFSGLNRTAPLGPWGEDGRRGRKSGVLVRAGRPIVLSVPMRYRDRLFLHYTRSDTGTSTVRLVPCAAATRAFSYDGAVGRVTGFSGGFSVTKAGCYPLDVVVEGGRSYRTRLPLGYPCR
jgi:hypothetical protein